MGTESVELAQIQIQLGTPPPPEVRSRRQRSLDLLLVTSVACAPLIFNSAWAYFLKVSQGFTRPAVGSLILHECLALGVLAYVLSQQRRSWRDIGVKFKLADVGMAFLLFVGGSIAFAVVQSAISASLPMTANSAQAAANGPGLRTLGWVGVLFILLNPVFEELIARGYFISELALVTRSEWIPPVASALLQGSYHLYQGVPAAAGITAGFLVWSFYFHQTRRLAPVVLAHLFADAYAFLGST
jgi:membrane protease YdiL (CAAX protease family)